MHSSKSKGKISANSGDCRMLPSISNLKKESLEATYEYINRLVKDETGENYDNVKEFIEYNAQLNVFEKKVQALIVDSLKVKEGVINGLLSDDLNIIRRVLKCDWFFEDGVSPEFYENTLFPNVSFSTRCKILTQLSKNLKSEQHAEHLFQFARHNYGSKYAELLLPRCSGEFISAYISECKPLFQYNNSVKALINMFKRHPKIVMSFLENVFHKDYPRKHERTRYSKLIEFIAKYYPDEFVPFFEKYHVEMRFFQLGKKLTKKFAVTLKKLIKNSSAQFMKSVMNDTVFFKCLTFEDQVDFFDTLVNPDPKKLSISNWTNAIPQITMFMRLKPPSERVRLLETAFYKIYNEKFAEHPGLWKPQFLEILPLDYRIHFVNKLLTMKEDEITSLKIHEECEDPEREIHDIFLYLLDCPTAFSRMTSIMTRMTTPVRRESLLKELIRNCVINEDAQSLEKVTEYILKKHKNDDLRTMNNVLTCFTEISPRLLNLNVWNFIEQLVTFLCVGGKIQSMYKSLMIKYIRFRLSNNMDVDSQVRNMIAINFVPLMYSCGLFDERKPFSKDLFGLFCNEIIRGIDNGFIPEDSHFKLLKCLLITLNDHNAYTKKNRINIEEYPLFVQKIDDIVQKGKSESNSNCPAYDLMKNPYFRNKYDTCLLQMSLRPYTLQHLLKYKPDYIINSLENILNDLFSVYGSWSFKNFITSRCRFDFLNISSKMEKLTCEKFKTSVSSNRKKNALQMYSYFANIEDFAELVKEYIPDHDKVHVDKDNSEFLEIQMTLPAVIKNIKPDSKNWPLILKYMNADFLRVALSSFNSACFNSPVRMVLPVLKEHFQTKSISVKKVLLHRMTDISVNEDKLNFFNQLWSSEKHSSVRAVVLKTISKCFIENPSNEIFEIVKKCITESDEVTIQETPELSKVPARYLNEYTISLWKFTEKFEGSRFTTNFRTDLIDYFSPMNIWILSEEFCEMILKRYLFVVNSKISVNRFACYYLISNPYSKSQKLNLILELMRDRRCNYPMVGDFLRILRQMSLEDPKRFVGVFDLILEKWPQIFPATKLFDEYLLLQYFKFYNNILKNYSFKTDESAKISADFGRELRILTSSFENNHLLSEIFRKTMCTIGSCIKDFDCSTMINHYLGDSFNQADAILAIGMLQEAMITSFRKWQSGDCSKTPFQNENFLEIVQKLKSMDDELIKIHLNLRFGNEID